MTKVYIVTGRINPERSAFSQPETVSHCEVPAEGINVQIKWKVEENQLEALVEGILPDKSYHNITIRDMLEELMEGCLSVECFISGVIHHVDILKVIYFGERPHQSAVISTIVNKNEFVLRRECKFTRDEIIDLCNIGGIALTHCLRDLRMALVSARLSPFFCYRSIETLRNQYAIEHCIPPKARKKQWKEFKSALGITNDEAINEMKDLATKIRHGEIVGYKEKKKIVSTAWDIAEAYMRYLRERNQQGGRPQLPAEASTPDRPPP